MLDFIINYEIKFRMGDELNAEQASEAGFTLAKTLAKMLTYCHEEI